MHITAIATATAVALLLGGCSTVLSGIGEPAATPVASNEITPAPSGSIESSPVGAVTPPVHGANAATASAAVTPRQPETTVALTPPPATAPGGVAYAEPGTTRSQLAGTWSFLWDDGQKSCKVKLSTDRGMSGFAADADVSCPNDIFMTKGWDVWGNEIVLQNHLGKVTARLHAVGGNRYDGVVTGDGGKVSLARL